MELAREESGMLDYWRIVVRRRWTVYLAVASVTLVVLIATFTATPLYRASTTLQIERRNPDILTFRDLSQLDYSWAAYSDFYQTQYKIIASEPVARRTAERLNLASHPQFERSISRLSLLARIKSLLPRQRVAVATDPMDSVAARVTAGLEITPIRNSQLVKISWVSSDPALAAAVANGVADAYIQHNMESQFSTSGQAEEFLVNQIATLKREIRELEEQLQDYGESKRILSIDESNNITLQALKDISERRTEAQTTLAVAEATYRAVTGSDPEALPEVINSSLVNRLRQEHATLEAEFIEQSARFGTGWPGLQTLRSKLDQVTKRLDLETQRVAEQARASAKAEYLRALNEVQNLDGLLAAQEQAAQRLKRDAVEFANLQSETQKKRETLDALIARQNEMALSTRLKGLDLQSSSNIKIVDRAKPPSAPFRPNTRLNLALGVFFGLVLGVLLAILLDHLDNTIGSVSELQRITGLSTLAVIPRHGAGGSPLGRVRRKQNLQAQDALDLVTHVDGRAGAAEAYRDLRTAILLSNPGKPPRSVVITSAIPEEGKTATAINLAVVLAQLGARVLLVDTDLRRPRLHKPFGATNRRGVSNVLSGLDDNIAQLAVSTGINHLDLLSSGPIPPNPSELLNSPTFAHICQRFQHLGYDHVIFDSPPVLSVSDAVIIANVVDSAILVVRAGRTPRQSVRLALEKLTQAGDCTPGVVLNDLDPDAPGSSHYGYGYYGRSVDGDTDPKDPGQLGGAAGA